MSKITKIKVTDRAISPFGGLNFVISEIEQAGIPAIINDALGARHGRSNYTWADHVLSLIYAVYCGAERLDDLATLKPRMHNSALNIPTPTALGRVMRHKISERSCEIGNHEFNINRKLNSLMLDIALKVGVLKAGKDYVLDFDNTIIPCEKEDAQFSYKKVRGYQPGVCFVGPVPVYIEGMNGNNPANHDQHGTLSRCLELLTEKGIGVRRFRADAASYQPKVLRMFDEMGADFFIRANNTRTLSEYVCDVFDWEPVRLGDDFFEVASFEYAPFGWSKTFRVVTTRRPSDKPHHITGQPFVYRSIITNNRELCDADVVWTYNQRGAIELNFDVLNNDWNWNKLPFSYLSENTAFMIITAMGLILYRWIIETFANRVDFIQETHRMKAFHYNVIAVAAEWKGDTLMIHDTSRPWAKLAG